MDGDSTEIMENINDSIGKCWYFRDPIEKTLTLRTNWKLVDAKINWLFDYFYIQLLGVHATPSLLFIFKKV